MMMSSRKRKGTPSNNIRECKCIKHTFLTHETPPVRLHSVTSKDFSKKALAYLKLHRLFGSESSYVCNVCISYATEKLSADEVDAANVGGSHEGDVSQNVEEIFTGVVEDIEVAAEEHVGEGKSNENNESVHNQKGRLLEAMDVLIGELVSDDSELDEVVSAKLTELVYVIAKKMIRPAITKHCKQLQGRYRDIKCLQNLNSAEFLSSVTPFLTRFLVGCTGNNFSMVNDTKMLFRIAVVIESIYHLKNSNTVLPHCFSMNVIQKQISGSKTVAVVNGKVLPSAGDSILREWWEVQGSEPLVTPSNIDIAVYFDNVGKYIVPSFRVKGERNSTPTVVTATMCIQLTAADNNALRLQSTTSYKTSLADLTEAEIQVRMLQIREEGVNDFRQYRYQFVCSLFKYMLASTEMDGMISNELEKLKSSYLTRVCSECGEMYLPRKRKCDVCGGGVKNITGMDEHYDSFENRLPKYLDVGQKGVRNPAKISTTEPIMKNPNSFENVECILWDIKDSTICEDEDEDGRKWVYVGADGPPYCLMRRIRRNDPEKYKWLAILSGKGHLQMNMLKCLFKFGDKICFNILGQDVLKYDTLKSYDYFIHCKDTHKSSQALEIFLIGTTMELIRVYGAQTDDPTPLGFFKWTSETENPRVKFMRQYLLNYVLAMYIHKVGERYNDFHCSNAGRMKFFDLFFALNHPIYREVEYSDLRERAISTDEVNALRQRNNSYANEDGELAYNHQDGDFKLEEIVRMMKRLSPKGKMDKKMWQRVARGMDNVDHAIKHCKDLLKIENEEATRITPVENEVVKWRAILRESQYLSNDNDNLFLSIDGEREVNPMLTDLTSVVEGKREKYFDMAQSTNLENIRYSVLNPFSKETSDSEEEEEQVEEESFC